MVDWKKTKQKLGIYFWFVGFPLIVLLVYFICVKLDIVTIAVVLYLIAHDVNLAIKCHSECKKAKLKRELEEN